MGDHWCVARYTHLARAVDEKAILRSGIKASEGQGDLAVVYAMPILPSFFASHQWLRELRRHRSSPLVAIDFVIPDREPVLVGHYTAAHTEMSAAEAAGVILRADDPRGYEVAVPRTVQPGEVRRTRSVPQVVGWRYFPDAHGKPPCSCEVCLRGTFGAARLRGD